MEKQFGLVLTDTAWEQVCQHAQDTFPEECCGVILSNGLTDQVQPLKNIQNQLHALDPETYPRTAVIAYAMDIKELESVMDHAQISGAKLKAFYHSHPGHEAYFSAEDKAFACPFGEPTFPESAQIVISIYDRKVNRICAYAWSDEEKDFVEVPLQKL